MLPQDLVVATVGVVPPAAGLAFSAGDPRVEGDPIAGPDSAHPVPGRLDHSGPVGADDVGKLESDSLNSLGEKEIEVIDRGGAHPNQDLVRGGNHRRRQVQLRQAFYTAVPEECQRPHVRTSPACRRTEVVQDISSPWMMAPLRAPSAAGPAATA